MRTPPLIVVLDANVLFPFTLRDTLLRAAAAGFYQVRWSAEILDETTRNLVSSGIMPAEKANRLRDVMTREFPEANVTGYEHLISSMKNDAKDRHVVAAAVHAHARLIATSNTKDFSPLPDGVQALSPDVFLRSIFEADPNRFIALLREQAEDLVNPPMTFDDLIARLARVVPEVVALVRERMGTV